MSQRRFFHFHSFVRLVVEFGKLVVEFFLMQYGDNVIDISKIRLELLYEYFNAISDSERVFSVRLNIWNLELY